MVHFNGKVWIFLKNMFWDNIWWNVYTEVIRIPQEGNPLSFGKKAFWRKSNNATLFSFTSPVEWQQDLQKSSTWGGYAGEQRFYHIFFVNLKIQSSTYIEIQDLRLILVKILKYGERNCSCHISYKIE